MKKIYNQPQLSVSELAMMNSLMQSGEGSDDPKLTVQNVAAKLFGL